MRLALVTELLEGDRAMGHLPSASRKPRLADDEWNLARRPPLVAGIAPIGIDDTRPKGGSFLFGGHPGMHRTQPPVHHHHDVRMVDKVAEPVGVTLVSALGGDEHNALGLNDRRGEHRHPVPPRLAADGVQLNNGHTERSAQHTTAAEPDRGPMGSAHRLEAEIREDVPQLHADDCTAHEVESQRLSTGGRGSAGIEGGRSSGGCVMRCQNSIGTSSPASGGVRVTDAANDHRRSRPGD